jgi:hypothetical protein
MFQLLKNLFVKTKETTSTVCQTSEITSKPLAQIRTESASNNTIELKIKKLKQNKAL